MTKREKIYIFLTVLAIVSIVVLEYIGPKKINWFPSYAKQHKIPFGTYVFRQQLEKTNATIIDVDEPPFKIFQADTISNGTYFFVNQNVSFGQAELNKILKWTAKGNQLFIASNNFEQRLLDTLNLNTSTLSNFNTDNSDYYLKLNAKTFNNDSIFKFNKANYFFYFNEIDTLNTKVVSTIQTSKEDLKTKARINTIKQRFGKGSIILSTLPQAFTNYFVLQSPNQDYTAAMLSYLNKSQPLYYDNHYKNGKTFYTSPMYIFLNNKPLKWAYYIMLIGVAFYVIFEGKRKQRAIPVVKPLTNQTVNFTRTIANMYYEKSEHKGIATHKIQHFLEYVRNQFHLNTNTINDSFLRNLAARSNNTEEATKQLFQKINTIQNRTVLTQKELEQLNTLIEEFKAQNSWKKKT